MYKRCVAYKESPRPTGTFGFCRHAMPTLKCEAFTNTDKNSGNVSKNQKSLFCCQRSDKKMKFETDKKNLK